jgi:hypothetical protein
MVNLSLNRAAKEGRIAKSTLLEALNSGRMSARKNDKGYWEIDPSELFRVFPKTTSNGPEEPQPTPRENHERTEKNSLLEIEIKMLREQIERADAERERERAQLIGQIETLRELAERQSADHRQVLAALTDQRERGAALPKRGFWGRLRG